MNSSEPNERFFEDLASAFDDDAAESAIQAIGVSLTMCVATATFCPVDATFP